MYGAIATSLLVVYPTSLQIAIAFYVRGICPGTSTAYMRGSCTGTSAASKACCLYRKVHLNRTQLLDEVKRLLMPGEDLPSDAYYCASLPRVSVMLIARG